MILRILLTFLIWFLTYIPLIVVSAFAVPVMLLNGWQGYTTWFGNRKYGRFGNTAYPATNRWREWLFLVIRNPISNFGKETMSKTLTEPVTVTGNPANTEYREVITGIARRKAAGRGRPARLRGQDGTEVVLTDALIDQIDDAITVAVQAQWDRYWQRVDAVQAATTVEQVNAVEW